MDFTEVKTEVECDIRLQCRSCLSVGRSLTPLGRFTNIFMKLSADLHSDIYTYPIEICWECESVLRKVLIFQEKVKKAQCLLLTNQSFIYGPLSSLTSTTLNETKHIIYLNDNRIQFKPNKIVNLENVTNTIQVNKIRDKCNLNNIMLSRQSCKNSSNDLDSDINSSEYKKKEMIRVYLSNGIYKSDLIEKEKYTNTVNNPTSDSQSNDNSVGDENLNENVTQEPASESDDNDNFVNDDFEIKTTNKEIFGLKTQIRVKQENVSEQKKSKSRWALKRAEQNRKLKFKIAFTNFHETFTKVQINNEELNDCMRRERDSEYYKSKRFKCDMCIFGFNEEKEFSIHKKIHSEVSGIYTCNICKTKVVDKRHLSVHIAQHYVVYSCTVCLFKFRSEEETLWHYQREHKKVFQCLKCELKFGSRRVFFKHFKDWHEKFICDHCGISFKMRYCIKDHIRKQHSPYTCAPCNKTFARYNGLWLHNKLEHSPAASPAYCVECDTTYKDIYRYKWHLCNSAKHTKKKNVRIPCPGCDKSFTKKIYMTDHYNLVHLKLFKYRCAQCDKNFIRNAELVKHRRRKHEGILPPKNKICYLCGRGFATNKILANHVLTHTGARPHARDHHTHVGKHG